MTSAGARRASRRASPWLAALLACAGPASAQPSTARETPVPAAAAAPVSAGGAGSAEPGSEYTVYLMTVGQGDAVWQRFGHNAIWIRNARTGAEQAYNWGMFDFEQPNFLTRFLTGETRYWTEPFDARMLVEHYARVEDRSVWRQELALTPAQRLALVRFVEWNALEQNKFYRYDYYRDNCSTRVRDALDRAVGGAIRAATERAATPTSYRWHTRRLVAGDAATYAGIQLALGRPADRDISAWEESFLPVRLMEHVRGVRVEGAGGALVPLVAREDTLYRARRAPERAVPPRTLGGFAAAGLGLAAGLAASGAARASAARRGRRSPAGAAFAGLTIAWTLVTGLAGVALLLAGTVTRHVYMGRNLNLAVVNPLALVVLAVAAIAFAVRRDDARRRWSARAARAAGLLAVLSAAGALAMLVPRVGQASWDIFALALPANLAMWWGFRAASEAWRARGPAARP